MGRAGSRFCRLARVRHHSRWAAPTGRPAPYPARPTNPTPPTELTTEPRNRSHTNRIRRHRITSQGAGFTSSQIYTGNGTPPWRGRSRSSHTRGWRAPPSVGYSVRSYRLIGLLELAAAVGLVAGLWCTPLGVAAATG